MNPLPMTFRDGGFLFRQLERSGHVAVFEKHKGHLNISFEVVRVRQVPETMMFGRIVQAHEAMPSSEHWGLYGWTYRDKAAAFRKFQELTQECPPLSTPGPKRTPILAGTHEPCSNVLDGTLVP